MTDKLSPIDDSSVYLLSDPKNVMNAFLYVRSRTVVFAMIVFGSFFFGSSAFSYFEWKYWCDVEDSRITVSLKTGEQKCFDYLAHLQSLENSLSVNISTAQKNIDDGVDIEYRTGKIFEYRTKREHFQKTESQVILAINDFENTLFQEVRKILAYHLRGQRTKLVESIRKVRGQQDLAKRHGNESAFLFLVSTIEKLQYRLFLLDRIQFSEDFEEMMPFLKDFLYGDLNQL